VSKALISKNVIKLKEKNLVEESIRNNFKFFKLSELGKIYQNPLDFINVLY